MTTQEKLHAVETVIRQALPRLTELSQGCKLEKDGYYYTYLGKFMVNVSPYTDGYYLHHFSSEAVVIPKKGKDFFIHSLGDKRFKYYNIIGHDIMLNDILEWLKELELSGKIKAFEVGFTPTGQFVIKYGKAIMFWDLSKLYLKDQSEELWNFLYNLIEQ